MARAEDRNFQNAGDIRVKGRVLLLADLRNMMNKPECSDVAFKCSDGVRVHACRLLLENRCETFRSMLRNEMLRTRLSVMPLSNVSSPVMLSVMEYIYTGTVDAHAPTHWRMGFEMIGAAQLFDIPALEFIASDFLRSQVSRPDHASQKSGLVDMLNVAVEFQEPWEGKYAVLDQLVAYIGRGWHEDSEDDSSQLSKKAMEYMLAYSKRDAQERENDPSVEEYFTFREIVLWHVYQAVPVGDAEARATARNVLPGGDFLSLWRKMSKIPLNIDGYLTDTSTESNGMESHDSTAILNSLFGTNIRNDSFGQSLSHVNLSRIPASLLLKVIHPLRIFPPRQLLKTMIQIAVGRRVPYSVSAADWKHGPALRTESDGQILCNSEDGSARGVAVAFIPTPRSSGLYEWEFEVLDDNALYIELGFVCVSATNVFDEDEILPTNLWRYSFSRILCINKKDKATYISRTDPQQLKDPKRFWDEWECVKTELKVNSVVSFKLNESERTCQVRFGDSLEAVWEDLPEGNYYPAVGFFKCKSARIQFRLQSHLDSF